MIVLTILRRPDGVTWVANAHYVVDTRGDNCRVVARGRLEVDEVPQLAREVLREVCRRVIAECDGLDDLRTRRLIEL